MPPRRSLALVLSFALASCGDEARPTAEPVGSNPGPQVVSAVSSAGAVLTDPPRTVPPLEGSVAAPPGSAGPATSSSALSAAPTPSGSASASATATASASAAAAVEPKPDTQGEQKKFPAFTAYLSAKGAYKVGEPAAVTAVVNALEPFHVNQEYPYKFKLGDAPAGISYVEPVVRNVSRTQMRATITIPFTPSKAGKATIAGECSLSVCNEASCVIEKVPLAVAVNVEE